MKTTFKSITGPGSLRWRIVVTLLTVSILPLIVAGLGGWVVFGELFEQKALDRMRILVNGHAKAIEKFPDRYEKLKSTMLKVFDDPDYKVAIEKTGRPWEFVSYADEAECMEYANNMIDLTNRYIKLLTAKGKSKKKKK